MNDIYRSIHVKMNNLLNKHMDRMLKIHGLNLKTLAPRGLEVDDVPVICFTSRDDADKLAKGKMKVLDKVKVTYSADLYLVQVEDVFMLTIQNNRKHGGPYFKDMRKYAAEKLRGKHYSVSAA